MNAPPHAPSCAPHSNCPVAANPKRKCLSFGICAVALALGAASLWAQEANVPDGAVAFKTDTLTVAIDGVFLAAMTDAKTDKNYLAHKTWLMALVVDGEVVNPTDARWTAPGKQLRLDYPKGLSAEIAVTALPSHVKFELLSVAPKEKVSKIIWGPFEVAIDQIKGDIIGQLRDETYAIGLQVLNPRTVSHGDINSRLLGARATSYEQPTAVSAYDYTFTLTDPDTAVAGSKIAIYGAPAADALATMGKIALAEGLPHVMVGDRWVKTLPGEAYLGFEFDETTIDHFIDVAKKAGILFIYHPAPWETWGHFQPKKSQFPNGMAGLKACVDKAHKAGIRVGLHTLSTFITGDDAYVTPRPDPRLATAGHSTLTRDISETDTVIEVADMGPAGPGGLRRCVIGEEILEFGNASGTSPVRLEGCTRGAFGTKARPHKAGTRIARLISINFASPIFFGNRGLNQEIARRAARICAELNLDKYEFDGLEGTSSCGLEHASAEFVQTWYDALPPDRRGRVLLGGSGMDNYIWHVFDCVNWGEPWGDLFRKSMLDYRFMRMAQYQRNLLPSMMGQYAATRYAFAGPASGPNPCLVEDIEWLMALRSGHDAGFSLTFTPDWEAYLRGKQDSPLPSLLMPNIDELCAAMHAWESAWRAGAFTPEIKTLLRDRTRDFHLKPTGPGSWSLFPMHVSTATLDQKTRQIKTENPHENGVITLVIANISAAPVNRLACRLPGGREVMLVDQLDPGETFKHLGGDRFAVHDGSLKKLREGTLDGRLPRANKGAVDVGIEWTGADDSKLQVDLRIVGPAWNLTADQAIGEKRPR